MIYEFVNGLSLKSIAEGSRKLTQPIMGMNSMPQMDIRHMKSAMNLQARYAAMAAKWLIGVLEKLYPKQKSKVRDMTLSECPEFNCLQLMDAYDKEPLSVKESLMTGPNEIVSAAMIHFEKHIDEISPEEMQNIKVFRDSLMSIKIPTKIVFEYLLAYAMHYVWKQDTTTANAAAESAKAPIIAPFVSTNMLPTTVKAVPSEKGQVSTSTMVRRIMYEYLPVVSVIALVDTTYSTEIKKLREECSKQNALVEEVTIWRGKATDLEKKLSEAEQKRIESINEASYDYESTIKSQQDEIDDLKKHLRSVEEQLELRDIQIESLASQLECKEEVFDDIELPEDNILVVGGHENWINKLKLSHPKWTFTKADETNAPLLQCPTCVLMFTNHLAHPQFHRVKTAYKDLDVPILYVTCVNLSMLDRQIKEQYKNVVLGQQ